MHYILKPVVKSKFPLHRCQSNTSSSQTPQLTIPDNLILNKEAHSLAHSQCSKLECLKPPMAPSTSPTIRGFSMQKKKCHGGLGFTGKLLLQFTLVIIITNFERQLPNPLANYQSQF